MAKWMTLLLGLVLVACASPTPGSPGFLQANNDPPISVELASPKAQDKMARPYRMFYDDGGAKKNGKLQIRTFTGHLRMADLKEIFGDVKNLPEDKSGNRVGGWVLGKGGLLWSVVVNPLTGAVNLLTIDPDGTHSSAIDLNGDGVADIVDIRLGDGRRYSWATEELGRDVFERWLLGENPLCEKGIVPGQATPPFGCEEDTGDGSAPTGGQIYDPWDSLCGEYAESTPRPRAPVMAHGGHGYGGRARISSVIKMNEQGGPALHTVTVRHFDDAGNHVSTTKQITYYDENARITRRVSERVDHTGAGTRTVTDVDEDGSTTGTHTETFEADLDEGGNYNPPDSNPPTVGPNGETSDPGPIDPGSDPGAMKEWCASQTPYVSGVERAAATDPAAFEVTCDDLVRQSSEGKHCVIVKWATPDDFDGTIHTPDTSTGCGNFQQPGEDGKCGPTTFEERLRGLTAQLASADLKTIQICPPIACDPIP